MSERLVKLLRITGRVQGVGYRDAMCQSAAALGVTGWVRNRRDGCVEALVCGEADTLAAITAWAHTGPVSAQVVKVVVTEPDGVVELFDTFEFRSTV